MVPLKGFGWELGVLCAAIHGAMAAMTPYQNRKKIPAAVASCLKLPSCRNFSELSSAHLRFS